MSAFRFRAEDNIDMRKGDVDTILPGTRSDSAQAKTIIFGEEVADLRGSEVELAEAR